MFDLDEVEEPQQVLVEHEPNSDDFLFAEIIPVDEQPVSLVISDEITAVAKDDLFSDQAAIHLDKNQSDITSDETLTKDHISSELALNEIQQVENESAPASNLMPQDILTLEPQQLVGDWNVDKWEYWFRNSALTPAVQELAQQGVMTGQIDGESLFNIPPKYEQLLTQLQHVLEQALKQEWPNTHFQVNYAQVQAATPYTLQHARKHKAHARAIELLHAETEVKDLLKNFDGELHHVQLK